MKQKATSLTLILALLSAGAGLYSSTSNGTGDGEKVAMILAQIIYQSRAGKVQDRTYTVAEADLNAFLKDQITMQGAAGVEEARVKLLNENQFITWLTVDMDKLDLGEGSWTDMLVKGIFSGRQSIELEGKLETSNGSGKYLPQRAKLNGTTIPVSLLSSVLKAVGARLQPPFDPTESFQLPYDLKGIDIDEGQALLTTGTLDPKP